MTEDELDRLLRPEVMEEIRRSADEDPSAFAMRHSGRDDLPARAIAEQIACRKKAAKNCWNSPGMNCSIPPVPLSRHQQSGWPHTAQR